MSQETLLLIDGSNLAFRMFYALEMSNLRDSKGNPTWAVYGTLKALFDTIEFAKPSSAAVAFDLPEPTYRHETFAAYKANRPDEMPEDLQAQWEIIKESFRKFHIPVLEEPGFEADDMIGIMAKKAESEGQKVIILSGDKDLFQLINENIAMAVPQRGGGLEIFTPEHVMEKMGVRPDQITDYKGIAGDSSDNIPGVKGLGPKAATNLLTEFGTLEGIYENIEKVGPPKTKEKLIEQEDSARMSKYISTIITDPSGVKSSDLNLDHCKLDMPDTDKLIQFLKDMEFTSILKRLPIVLKPFNNGNLAKINVGELPETSDEMKQMSYSSSSKTNNKTYSPKNLDKWDNVLDKELKTIEVKPFVVLDEMALDSLIKDLNASSYYAIDLETSGLNTLNCDIVGWAFAIEKDSTIKSFYIPVRHQSTKQLDPNFVLAKLKPILEDNLKLQIIQNAKFEQKIFSRAGIRNHNNFFDTMLASYIDNPANKHGLKAQSKRIFHLRMTEIDELIGTGSKQVTIDTAPLNEVAAYAAADAYTTLKLYKHYKEKLDERELKLLQEMEFPLIEVLRDLELAGISLDTEFLKIIGLEIHQQINAIESTIHKACNEVFNVSSPKQLSEVLFTKLALPVIGKKNKSGTYSTDIDTLETLINEKDLNKEQITLIENIIEYRTLSKLSSTYVDNLPGLISKETGRLHSDFNQVVTATGRLSSSNPNLQNIPIKSKYGKLIRKAFVAKDSEHLLISADYSQIELRVLAHMADEPALIEAFNNNMDIHKRTAMEIFELKENAITEEYRRVGKTLNFALIYMQGPFATAKQLGISMSEAKDFISKYFKAFKKIKPFMDSVLESAHENEYTETLFGRRRYFRNINSPNKILSKEEERQAFNAALQGTAADIMKRAMINLYCKLKEKKYQSQIILQVHDELVLEVPIHELDLIKELITQEMSSAAQLKVPLLVDIGSGHNWLEMG